MKSIKDIDNLDEKTVVLRADLNIKNIDDAFKLHRGMETFKFLANGAKKLVMISHRGRPKNVDLKGGVPEEFDLRPIAGSIEKELDKKIVFLDGFDFSEHKKRVSHSDDGSVFMLENLRLHPGENSDNKEFAFNLSCLADVYVNDAFGSWHSGASVSVLPGLLPTYIGFLMEQEINHLRQVLYKPKKPLVVVLGGGKAADKFSVIKNLYDSTDKFLIGGVLANTFKSAMGEDIKDSQIDQSIVEDVKGYLNDKKIVLPVDFVRDEEGHIFDLGAKAREDFAKVIAAAGTVIWNGPLGYFEKREYRAGSEAIAIAIANSSAFSVVGGGETTQLILQMEIEKRFSWLSTGGGAMLAFLAGKRIASLRALGYYEL